MNHKTLKEANEIIARAKDLSSSINRMEQDKGAPREVRILMHGMRDQGEIVVFDDPEALPGECVVRQCYQIILEDFKAERTGLFVRFKEL